MDTSTEYIKSQKLSVSMRGNANQEKRRSPETRARIASSMRGNTNTLGKVYDDVTRRRDGLAKLGEKNPCWRGGSSFEPYSPQFNSLLREAILERDNFTCQFCGRVPNDRKKLHPHHIDYNKSNCAPLNLVTLCHSCHSKTNHHRDQWKVRDGRFQRIPANA